MKKHSISLEVNGTAYQLTIQPNKTLLDILRDELNMPETKYGCGTGECGACTVLVDDRKVINSCLTLAVTMDGKSITTAAGLQTADGTLHPIQEAFVENAAVQCGYCTPGMVLKSVGLLKNNPNPSEDEIRDWLEGNICRCTGYEKIVTAVQLAGKKMAKAGS
ncbi:MAG: (2Fe-2S)-binding protein [Candidatus Thiodiazotropha sp. (ex. Lucinisca nassula)]|nr:(2Fe-2S)-binding protein [Candidatus Thiodiazotropha sp. (ex. Lucinisca nassula)]